VGRARTSGADRRSLADARSLGASHYGGYRLSEGGKPNHPSTLCSKRVIAQIRSPLRPRTKRPAAGWTPEAVRT